MKYLNNNVHYGVCILYCIHYIKGALNSKYINLAYEAALALNNNNNNK